MEGIIVNYRRGKRTQTTNQMIIMVPGITDKKSAEKLVGKTVTYECEGKNKTKINGKITFLHGNNGAVRALFEKGMPGQAIGDKIKIN